jgi:hypothetical protein
MNDMMICNLKKYMKTFSLLMTLRSLLNQIRVFGSQNSRRSKVFGDYGLIVGVQLLLRSKTRYYSRGSIIADSREQARGLIVITSGQVFKPELKNLS